ncbi:hypothetical protein LSAT2_024361 [Lamellibrachia satsuma]|nr:hypothetical protein LSAT2_024361 [Lamellibrachia satsuma]
MAICLGPGVGHLTHALLVAVVVTLLVDHGISAAHCRFASNSTSQGSCIFPCRCADGCDTTTGECINGGQCEDGHPSAYRWSGTACQIGHVSILANEISDFFESVTKDFPPLLPIDEFLPPGADTTVPYTYIINVDELAISLSRIKTHKATGPDEIPKWILHDYAAILAPPVCAIFDSSLQEGTVPALWKCADVRPVPKFDKHR